MVGSQEMAVESRSSMVGGRGGVMMEWTVVGEKSGEVGGSKPLLGVRLIQSMAVRSLYNEYERRRCNSLILELVLVNVCGGFIQLASYSVCVANRLKPFVDIQ